MSDVANAIWIVYDSFVQFGREDFQIATAIEPEWIMVSYVISPVYSSLLYILVLQLF